MPVLEQQAMQFPRSMYIGSGISAQYAYNMGLYVDQLPGIAGILEVEQSRGAGPRASSLMWIMEIVTCVSF